MSTKQSTKQRGTPAVRSTAWLARLTEEAYEVGRKTAYKKAGLASWYTRSWREQRSESKAGFKAMVKWIVEWLRANARPEWRGARGVETQKGRAIPRPLQAVRSAPDLSYAPEVKIRDGCRDRHED